MKWERRLTQNKQRFTVEVEALGSWTHWNHSIFILLNFSAAFHWSHHLHWPHWFQLLLVLTTGTSSSPSTSILHPRYYLRHPSRLCVWSRSLNTTTSDLQPVSSQLSSLWSRHKAGPSHQSSHLTGRLPERSRTCETHSNSVAIRAHSCGSQLKVGSY